MICHGLKTDSTVYDAVASGKKTFELRRNDRDFAVDDVLHLRETKYASHEMMAGDPLVYTGREVSLVITHVFYGPCYGLKSG